MISKNTLRNLVSRALASTVRRTSKRRKNRNSATEPLETRALLAVFTVTSTADTTAAGTLRSAINQANSTPGDDEIKFDVATNGIEFDLAGTQFSITESLTITGNGATATVIDALSNSRIFDISGSAVNVSISGVTLKNGRVAGAGLQVGGAILFNSTGTLSISGSVLSTNTVDDTTGSEAYGGAVFVQGGSLEIFGSTVTGNTADWGGALYANGNSDVSITSSTVVQNVASNDGGAIYAGFGGQGDVTITGSTLQNNQSQRRGGAIKADNVAITGGSTVRLNSAATEGGAIHADGNVTVTNSTMSGNTASGDGGAIFSIGSTEVTNSTLANNSTTGDNHRGGAIHSSSGAVTISQSTLSGNSTAGSNSDGGAIYAFSGAVTISQSTLSGNSTAGSFANGGAIYAPTGTVTISQSTLSGNSTAGVSADGGAIYAFTSAMTISQSTLSGNSTAGSFADGGAIYAVSGAVTISQSTLSGNSTAGSGTQGGAIYTVAGSVTISQSTLSGNSTAGLSGGAIFSASSPVTIRNSIIAGNSDNGTAPDVRKSPNVDDTFTVTNSLIGRNNGTDLTATVGTTPGANGNLIGGDNAGAAINPLLGPLANNGGPTQTHALLSTSPAIDQGSNTLAAGLTTDQRGNPFARIFNTTVDMGAFERAILLGTANADAFVLTYSSLTTSGTVTVTISTNGGPATSLGTFPMNAALTIDGLGGTDSVRVVGTIGADTAAVNSVNGLVVNGASLILQGIENRTLAGGAGGDVYRFDADTALGVWTLDESGGGTDTVDFLPTTTVGLVLNLATSGTQPVHATNLSLILGSAATIENATGGSGADTLFGNGLDNTLNGGAGDDRLIGAGGSDLLLGGANNDRYDFFPTTVLEADQVTENANEGIDTLNFAFLTTDVVVNLASTSIQPVHLNRTLKLNSATVLENLVGGSGADRLFGNSLDNNLTAGAGDDQLIGAGGNDLMLGGADNDTYVFVPATVAEADTVSENLNQGTDTLSFAFLTTNVIVNLGSTSVQTVHTNRTLKLNSAVVFENIIGGSGADTLFGNTLSNTLTGNAGDDKLLGSSGNDVLLGGANNDIYMFVPSNAAEADTVTENANEGIDTLNFAFLTTSVVVNLGSTSVQTVNTNRTLKLNSVSTFENAVGGTGNDTLLGNAVANRLTGGLGDNILVGLEGGDILEAGNGRDILIGGLGLDILKGDAGDDILIAGRTTSDTSLSNLSTLRTQWISANAYATRVANLRAGVGSPLVSLKTTINVLNDAGEDDVLFGGTNTDWFFRAVDDVIADLFAGELIDVL
jgi:predicted outer membrane repeat protein